MQQVILGIFSFGWCFFGHAASGILVPGPGIKPTPPASEGAVLTTGPPGKSQHLPALLSNHWSFVLLVLPWWLSGKEPTCQCRRRGSNPWVGKIPWRRKREPTPVFLPGKSHGWRSLEGYSPRGHIKEPIMTQ